MQAMTKLQSPRHSTEKRIRKRRRTGGVGETHQPSVAHSRQGRPNHQGAGAKAVAIYEVEEVALKPAACQHAAQAGRRASNKVGNSVRQSTGRIDKQQLPCTSSLRDSLGQQQDYKL